MLMKVMSQFIYIAVKEIQSVNIGLIVITLILKKPFHLIYLQRIKGR